MSARDHLAEPGATPTGTEKDINHLDETEVAADHHISARLQTGMSYSKGFPPSGLRKTLAAPFLPFRGNTPFQPSSTISLFQANLGTLAKNRSWPSGRLLESIDFARITTQTGTRRFGGSKVDQG